MSYTLAYSRGNTSGNGVAASGFQVLDDMHLELNEGPTNFDTRHNFVVSGRRSCRAPAGLNVSWVARALSGSPFSLTNGEHRSRPERHPGRAAAGGRLLRRRRRPLHREELQGRAQRRVRPGVLQRSTRGSAIGSACQDRRQLELFADVFNVTNHTNFANPTGNQASPQFLLLTAYSTSYAPRKVQIGARFEF